MEPFDQFDEAEPSGANGTVETRTPATPMQQQSASLSVPVEAEAGEVVVNTEARPDAIDVQAPVVPLHLPEHLLPPDANDPLDTSEQMDDTVLTKVRRNFKADLAFIQWLCLYANECPRDCDKLREILHEIKGTARRLFGNTRNIAVGEVEDEVNSAEDETECKEAGKRLAAWIAEMEEKVKNVAQPQISTVEHVEEENDCDDADLPEDIAFEQSTPRSNITVTTDDSPESHLGPSLADDATHDAHQGLRGRVDGRLQIYFESIEQIEIETSTEDYFEESASTATAFLKKLEEKFNAETRVQRDQLILMLERYDPCASVIKVFLTFSEEHCDLRDIEKAIACFGQVHTTKMELIKLSKNISSALSGGDYCDMVECSLAATLLKLTGNDKSKSAQEMEESPMARAAQVAAVKFAGRRSAKWKNWAKLSQKGKPFIVNVAFRLVVIRVLRMNGFYHLMEIAGVEDEQLDEYKAFVEEFLPGHRLDISAADVFESALIPASRIESSPHNQVMRRKVASAMMDGLLHENSKDSFATSEAVPVGVMMETVSEDKLARLKRDLVRYLSADGDLGGSRRIQAVQMLFSIIEAKAMAKSLKDLGMSEEYAAIFPLGNLVTAASQYRNSCFHIFQDERMFTPSEADRGFVQKAVDGPVAQIVKSAVAATKAFMGDHMWADLTNDLQLGKRRVLDLYSAHASCLLETEDNGSDESHSLGSS